MQTRSPSLPSKRKASLGIVLLTLGGILIGAAIFPWFIQLQQNALNVSAAVLPPVPMHAQAPDLQLVNLDGHPASLKGLLGQVILVNNWATWCPPCRLEMPELQAFYAAHVSQGFTVIAINSGDPIEKVSTFVRQMGLDFPVWLDPQENSLEAFHNWNLPSSYLIDRSGLIQLEWTGEINRSTLEKYVTPYLEK